MASDVSINLKLLTASFDQGMGKVQKQLKTSNLALSSFVGNIAAIGFSKLISGATQAAGAILEIGQASLLAAIDAEETASKFDAVFSDITASADATAKHLQDAYGLGVTESKTLLSATGDLLTGFGFSQEGALGLSADVQKLAVDLASFTNFSGGAAGASEALTKALLGERESVKALGISIQEKDVQEQVALNRAAGLTFASERQAKAQATLDIALRQSGNALGDYAKTSGSAANQLKLMQTRAEDLKIEIGQALTPVFSKLAPIGVAAFEEISKFVKENQNNILSLVKNGIVLLLDGLVELVNGVEPVADAFIVMKNVGEIAFAGIRSGIATIGIFLGTAAQGWIEVFRTVVEALPSSLVPEGWAEGLITADENVKLFNESMLETIAEMGESIDSDFTDIGETLNSKLISEKHLEVFKGKVKDIKKEITGIGKITDKTQKKTNSNTKKNQTASTNNTRSFYSTWKSQVTDFKSFSESTNKDRVANMQSTLGTISTLTTSNNKALFAIGKAAAISQATIDGIAATQKALASAPPPFNFALAALVGVASAANVAKIASAKPPSAGNFADGGFIPGTSFSGDKLTANVNSSEVVLNTSQQREFMNLANGGGASNSSMAEAINNLALQPIMIQVDGETVFEVVRSQVESGKELNRN